MIQDRMTHSFTVALMLAIIILIFLTVVGRCVIEDVAFCLQHLE